MTTDKQGRVDVTIVIPALNEESTLPQCLQNAFAAVEILRKRGLRGEVLVVDNNSSDRTAEVAAGSGARVVSCPERGYGRALIRGTNEARGRFIIMGDADCSYDFTEAVPMLDKLLEGYDLCMGNRFKGEIKPGAMPFKNRYLGNPLLTGILNLLFRSGMGDAHCGLRAFTKEAFEKMKLESHGMEFASEMVVKAALLNLKRTELPVTLHPDKRGRPPHLKPWRDGWRHLKFLLLHSPLWLFCIPSLFMILLSSFIFLALMLTRPGDVFSLGDFWIGDHWFVLAGGLFTLGFTGLIFAAAALVVSAKTGFRKLSKPLKRMYRIISVERIIIVSLVILAIGVAILSYVVVSWFSNSFGPMMKLREMVLATTFIVVGIQTFFGGLFIASLKNGNDLEK